MIGEEEIFIQCPYCWQAISMVFESNYPKQDYIEDCEVCCNPIQIYYDLNEEGHIQVDVKKLND
jgi:hypothetical protein